MGSHYRHNVFAAFAVAVLVLAGCGSSNGGVVKAQQTSGTSQTIASTTTTTLSPAACLGVIQQVQAGTKTVTTRDYERQCGTLPAGLVLVATTTTIPPTTTTTTVRYSPPPPPPTAAPQQNCPNGGYTNSSGNYVCSPYSAPSAPPGATAQCNDGTYSSSQHRSGTCSSHGGVAQWL